MGRQGKREGERREGEDRKEEGENGP